MNPLRIVSVPQNIWPKEQKIFILSLRGKVYGISERTLQTKMLILSLVFIIIFQHFVDNSHSHMHNNNNNTFKKVLKKCLRPFNKENFSNF